MRLSSSTLSYDFSTCSFWCCRAVVFSCRVTSVLAFATAASQAIDNVRIDPRAGSRVWIEGQSNVHDWACRAVSFEARVELDADGCIRAPSAPGLGLTPDLQALADYLVDVEITVDHQTLFRTGELRP